MSDTHVNAFKMELQEAELEASRAKDRVDALKRTISSMEAEGTSTEPETPVEETPEPTVTEEAQAPEETPVEEEKAE